MKNVKLARETEIDKEKNEKDWYIDIARKIERDRTRERKWGNVREK